mmetsp:Transcript_29549/g.66968  ORF Transcript_29549/g.66968 Transcript_29549/m.66968 type:complete len:254 (+) Transcript_29549:604-1365(+)
MSDGLPHHHKSVVALRSGGSSLLGALLHLGLGHWDHWISGLSLLLYVNLEELWHRHVHELSDCIIAVYDHPLCVNLQSLLLLLLLGHDGLRVELLGIRPALLGQVLAVNRKLRGARNAVLLHLLALAIVLQILRVAEGDVVVVVVVDALLIVKRSLPRSRLSLAAVAQPPQPFRALQLGAHVDSLQLVMVEVELRRRLLSGLAAQPVLKLRERHVVVVELEHFRHPPDERVLYFNVMNMPGGHKVSDDYLVWP